MKTLFRVTIAVILTLTLTVTLTRGTKVQRDLTVSAGVTLELTGDGGLHLNDNITLTANGTEET